MKPSSAHSFPDAEVVSWRLSDDRLEIEMSDVFFEGNLCGPAKLVFPLIRSATVMLYDHELNEWNNQPEVEPLKDICEFHYKKEKLYSLKGFGVVSGKWISMCIVSCDAEISW